jgi:hypothetical protein
MLRLDSAWKESQRHLDVLAAAAADLTAALPFTGESCAALSGDTLRAVDQFVLRFTKLQDAAWTRLFPALLIVLGEPYEDRSMIDRLDRLEKLGYIDSADHWQEMRVLRNRFAHEYPEEPEKIAANLNLCVQALPSLRGFLARIAARLPAKLRADLAV